MEDHFFLSQYDFLHAKSSSRPPDWHDHHQFFGLFGQFSESVGEMPSECVEFGLVPDGVEFLIDFHSLSAVGHIDLWEEQFHVAVEERLVDKGKLLDVGFLFACG